MAFEWAWLSGYEILWDQNEKNANPEAYWELVVARFGIPLIIFRYSMAKSHGWGRPASGQTVVLCGGWRSRSSM